MMSNFIHSKINSLLTSCLTCSFPPSLASCICPFYSLSILFWGKVFYAHYHDYYFSPCRPLLTGKGLLVIGGSLQWLYARNFIQPIRGEPLCFIKLYCMLENKIEPILCCSRDVASCFIRGWILYKFSLFYMKFTY